MDNVEYADLVGKPFKLNGRGPDGFDCYGLVREMFRRQGISTPDYSVAPEGASNMSRIVTGIQEWKKVEGRPGTMVMFRLPATLHVGYVLPHGKMIHTWEKTGGVCVERLEDWKRKVIGYYEY